MTGKLKTKPPTVGQAKLGPMARDREDAARLQKAGTHGDTVLAHINPAEARLLDALADGLLDGGGRNPKTGLLSFGMSDGESGRGGDSNPGGVGGGPAGGQTGGGIGGNTSDGQGGLGGGYGDNGYAGSANQRAAQALGDYYQDNYIGGMLDSPYAAKDTWQRVLQEYVNPSVRTPGRLSAPTAAGPGIMGSFVSQIAGGPFSAAMGIGAAMGRASSKATQEASAAEMGARGSRNSTGQQASEAGILGYGPGGLYDENRISPAGTASGAETAKLPQVPPGYMMNPAGQIVPLHLGPSEAWPMGGEDRAAWKDPAENLLYDYIWRGRQGKGLLGW
jgi:hypothetical protein